VRQRSDENKPDWQCPACQVAYVKAKAQHYPSAKLQDLDDGVSFTPPAYRGIHRILNIATIACAFFIALSYWLQTRPIPTYKIDPQIAQIPVQESIDKTEPFRIEYQGHVYDVQPVADYELWGLVVSHNDISSISDIYHDETSLDTRDLCVIWGENVTHDGFHQVDFRSGPWTCYFQYQYGVRFNHDHLSNNHLITDDNWIREQLNKIRIGDQIVLRGQLVNYRDQAMPEFWRKSSLTREDAGNGACEVLFVKELQVVQSAHTGSRWTLSWSIRLLILLMLLKAAVFIREVTTH
jgi:hypothetical protein